MERMDRKVYVITGATSGIGRALCESFSRNSIVFAGYRNVALRDELSAFSDNVVPFYIDMTDKNSIASAAEFIKSKTQRVDRLINVAGCVVAGAVENLDIDSVRRQFEVNTFSHLDLTQRLLPIMTGGRIINISSMASFGLFPFVAAYGASKRALDILFNSLMLEKRGDIRIISVKPGVIATPLWEKSISENRENIEASTTYSKEMRYMLANARANGERGLPVQRVVEVVEKIDKAICPLSSYTVGKDAFVAEIASRLPQDCVNFLVRTCMRLKGLRV